MIPVAGISLLYCAIAHIVISWRAQNSFRKTGNITFRFYYHYSIILAIAFVIYGFFPLFTPFNGLLLRFSYLTATAFVFASFAFLLRFIVLILKRDFLAVILPFISILCGTTVIMLGLLYPQSPFVDQYGLYHPNQSVQFDIAFAFSVAIITIPVGILFMFSPFKNIRLKLRSVFLGIGFFIASIGAVLAISRDETYLLSLGFILMPIGFTFMLVLFLFSPDVDN